MKRSELLALAERIEKKWWAAPEADETALAALAAFVRQIAQSQPMAWRFEVRGTKASGEPETDWREYSTYSTEKTARRAAKDCTGGGIECRVVPLYTLPIED